jgi:hypothetical protein
MGTGLFSGGLSLNTSRRCVFRATAGHCGSPVCGDTQANAHPTAPPHLHDAVSLHRGTTRHCCGASCCCDCRLLLPCSSICCFGCPLLSW